LLGVAAGLKLAGAAAPRALDLVRLSAESGDQLSRPATGRAAYATII
jgi:hypothetical protein